MRKAVLVAACCVLTVSLCGCRSWKNRNMSPADKALLKRYETAAYPANPVPGLRRVAVVVVDASVQYPPNLLDFSSALYDEFQQIKGIEVIPNRITLSVIEREGYLLPRDGLKLADSLKADGVFVAVVTDFNPYSEPSIAMALTLFSRAAPMLDPVDLDRVIQGGRPCALPSDPALGPITAVYGVFDAAQEPLRKHMQWFAKGRTAESEGYGWERYYRSMPNYMHFVSYEMAWKVFTRFDEDVARARARHGGLPK